MTDFIYTPKPDKTAAARMKRYREKKLAAGETYSRGKGGKNAKWDVGQFIALDGEGESSGPLETFTVGEGKTQKTYSAKDHIYTLLAASSGESLFNGGERLETQACLDFLLDLSDAHKKAIFVIFAGSYDINHMLMFGFDRETIQKISRGETVELLLNNIRYQIEYRARKSLTLRRNVIFYEGADGKTKMKWESRIIVWDVWGFFQDSFIGVMEKWLGKDHKHYALIKDMKARRGDFENVPQLVINNYNAAELECLVEIMDKVRDAITGLDLKCRRWDGAGAVAAALMLKHNIKEFKAESPDEVMEAARTAYAGGRIEICKIGTTNEFVYDYDINSAYPSVMAGVPCLRHGNWTQGDGDPPAGFTLVHCSFNFEPDLRFYPLFYRTARMQISFPSSGEGIYWFPEYEAALLCPGEVTVIKWYHWQPACNHKPFHWIEDYYRTRQQWVKAHTEEWQLGGEKIIKLGLNSLYGKCAQQIGGKDDKPPAYHQLEWAGYITSATRARLYTAAMTDPESIIGFATDGIFCTKRLPIECSVSKQMGAWELKEPVPIGMTIAMAGVYWWHYDDNKYGHYSRGFDKDSMKTPDNILNAWKAKLQGIDISMQRLIGMGSAAASDTLWQMRGRFTTGMRTLRLDGKSHKRNAVDLKARPNKKLFNLNTTQNLEYETGAQTVSYAYPLQWLEFDDDDDYEKELEFLRELGDTENI